MSDITFDNRLFNRFGETIGNDGMASLVVFLVALPLCMGISIASGVSPMSGLVTGLVGGLLVALISGSPLQVSGPAAGLTVLVWQLVQHQGIAMLGVIVLLAGIMQFLAGVFRLGQWFRAVSPAVIHGMLAGIGILIFASQFHVMLDKKPIGNGIANFAGIPIALSEAIESGGPSLQALGVGLATMFVMILWSRFAPSRLKLLPAPLMGVVTAVIVSGFFHLRIKYVPDLLSNPADINNIWSVIHFPSLSNLYRMIEPEVLIAAASVAFIASAETLLSASALDQLHQGPRTRYDKELIAQGAGNAVCGLLGVLPMTGVIVRSTANVEAGGKTRAAAFLHGVWMLVFVSLLPSTLSHIPVSSLAAVLVFTGYKLAYPKAVPGLLKFGKSEVAIYLVTIFMIVESNLLQAGSIRRYL